jgi:GrpB-like predicted nucleotidyltransferase (UPF0157 family)
MAGRAEGVKPRQVSGARAACSGASALLIARLARRAFPLHRHGVLVEIAMLGLKHNVNSLVNFDPDWPAEFSRESRRIAEALGDLAKGIEHYGSTAVTGMRAKPIIDVLVGVSPFEDWDGCRDRLERLGYDYAAHAGVPRHHIFGRGRDTTERTYRVHVVAFLGRNGVPALRYEMLFAATNGCGLRVWPRRSAPQRRLRKAARDTMNSSSPSWIK